MTNDSLEQKIFLCLIAGGQVMFTLTHDKQLNVKYLLDGKECYFPTPKPQNKNLDMNAEADAQVAILLDSLGIQTQE